MKTFFYIRYRMLSLLFFSLLLSSCELFNPVVCPTDMSVDVHVIKRTLHVGEIMQAKVAPSPCYSDRIFRWSSDKPEVLSVDAISGLITAKSVGEAQITATSQETERRGFVGISVVQ